MFRLYGYSTSPFVRKVGCCLYYKKIPFEFIPVNPIDPKRLAFTHQSTVPVLELNGAWRVDSTEIALWLDELSPAWPLFGKSEEERRQILRMDRWVTDSLILSGFRSLYEAKLTSKYRAIAWRLAAIVSSQTPLSQEIQEAWPDLLKMSSFIQHMMFDVDHSESLKAMRSRVTAELVRGLEPGPFFGGFERPTLLDLTIYSYLIFNYMVGIEDELPIRRAPSVVDWLGRVSGYLPENPLLVEDFMIVHPVSLSTGRSAPPPED